MKNTFTLFTFLTIVTFTSFSQSGRLNYANKMFATQSYYYASQAYEDCIARKTDSSEVASNIATSYDKIGNTEKALDWYRFLNRKGSITKDEQLRLGLLERQVGNYQESELLMASYSNQYGELDVAKSVVTESASIEKLQANSSNFELTIQDKINTSASEMGTNFYTKDEVIVASASRRKMAPMRIHSWTGDYFYDLYRAPVDENGQIGKMKLIKSKVQSKFNDGPAVYDSTSGYFYFTRNNFLDGKKGMDENQVIRLKIYRAKMEGEKFKDAEEMTFNSDDFSNAHPTLSKDGKHMYFSSDRPGGLGGMDLYYITLDENGNTVGAPVNMGNKINTTQNDVFPFYNEAENILFFSSEGHAGLGGLDVYVAKLNKQNQATKIENLGAPINSSKDDLSYASNDAQTMGYFASNREGGEGSDDIYSFKQQAPIKNSATLTGNSKDLISSLDLEDAKIYLADKNGNIIDSAATKPDGSFEFPLNGIEDDFQLLGSKDGYITGKKMIDYQSEKMEYNENLDLMPIIAYHFTGLVTDKASGSPLDGVKVTVTDNKNNTLFENVNTHSNGDFKTTILPYKYQDNITYNFKLEKEGYLGKTVSYSEVLALQNELNVNGKLDFSLTKVEKGKDISDEIGINPIYFDLNKSNIRPDAAIELDKVVKFLQDNPSISLELGSHTDSRGSNASNLSLSDRRAKSSAAYIVSKGINKSRIAGKGYGENKLKVSDTIINAAKTEEEKEVLHQQNRRTEFIIVKMN